MPKTFVRDLSQITVDELHEHPIWMDAHWFDKEDLIKRYGPEARRAYEPSRVAYLGSLPYPHFDGDDDHSPMVCVRSRCTFRTGESFDGIAIPASNRLLSYSVFVGASRQLLHHGPVQFLSDKHREETVARWKASIESSLGPFHKVFPAVVEIEEGLLPPEVTRVYTLRGLTYYSGDQEIVVI
jgi:hypothetical protein